MFTLLSLRLSGHMQWEMDDDLFNSIYNMMGQVETRYPQTKLWATSQSMPNEGREHWYNYNWENGAFRILFYDGSPEVPVQGPTEHSWSWLTWEVDKHEAATRLLCSAHLEKKDTSWYQWHLCFLDRDGGGEELLARETLDDTDTDEDEV